jgi:hypothetical protein
LTHVVIKDTDRSTLVDLFTTYLIAPSLVSLKLVRVHLGDSFGGANLEGFLSSPVVLAFVRSHADQLHVARVDLDHHHCEIKTSDAQPVCNSSATPYIFLQSYFQLTVSEPSTPLEEAFFRILSACALDKLVLRASRFSEGAARHWTEVLGSGLACCTLRTIRFESQDRGVLLEALMHTQLISGHCVCDSATDAVDPEGRTMVHFLHNLDAVTFQRGDSYPRGELSEHDLLSLKHCFDTRANAGLRPLMFRGLNVPKEKWKALVDSWSQKLS